MDNSLWNLYDEIILVCKKTDKNNYYKAYVVNPNNKTQLETARRWAIGYNKKENKTYEFTYDNKDFKLEIISSADNSSQGGKLSFWKCLIKKEGNIFEIGINSELLSTLIKHTTIKKGQVEELVSIARYSGQVGVLTDNMTQYKEAVSTKILKEKRKKSKKTSIYKKGKVYSTLTKNDLCLGNIKAYYEILPEFVSRDHQYILANPVLVKLDTPKDYSLCVDYNEKFKQFKSIKDIFKNLYTEDYWGNEEPNIYPLRDITYKNVSRVEEDTQIILNDTIEDINNYIDKCLDYLEKKLESKESYMKGYYKRTYYSILCFKKDIPNVLTISKEEYNKNFKHTIEREKKLIKDRWEYIKEVEIRWV